MKHKTLKTRASSILNICTYNDFPQQFSLPFISLGLHLLIKNYV